MNALIVVINDKLIKIAQIKHSIHLSFNNFIGYTWSTIAVYCFLAKKPVIDVILLMTGNCLFVNFILNLLLKGFAGYLLVYNN